MPPVCVGIPYRKTSEAPAGDEEVDSPDTTEKLGAFKFTCVGYAQRAFPYYARDRPWEEGGGGEGGGDGNGNGDGSGSSKPSKKNHLPYCVGLQILVADKVLPGSNNNNNNNDNGDDRRGNEDDAAGAAEAGRRRTHVGEPWRPTEALWDNLEKSIDTIKRGGGASQERGRTSTGAGAGAGGGEEDKPGAGAAGTGPSSSSPSSDQGQSQGQGQGQGQGQQRGGGKRLGSPSQQSDAERLRALIEGSKGPGYVFPSAEFEQKFVKSAGKIWSNMKRHANYIANLVSAGPGGMMGSGGGGGGSGGGGGRGGSGGGR